MLGLRWRAASVQRGHELPTCLGHAYLGRRGQGLSWCWAGSGEMQDLRLGPEPLSLLLTISGHPGLTQTQDQILHAFLSPHTPPGGLYHQGML